MMHMDLVSITSQEENERIYKYIRDTSKSQIHRVVNFILANTFFLGFRRRRHLLDFRHQDDRRRHVGVDVNGAGRGLHQLVRRPTRHRR